MFFTNLSITEESYIFEKEDLVLNFNKWKKDSHNNILYVTGLSGSGKTTLAEKYEKEYKAYMFEIDGIEYNYDSSNLGLLDKAKEKYPKYKEMVEDKSYHGKRQKDDVILYIKVLNFIISDMKKQNDKLFIVEGIQLFQWKNPNSLKGKPLIIKGTSVMKSILQRFKRNGNGKIDWIAELKNEFPKLIGFYNNMEKDISKLKKNL